MKYLLLLLIIVFTASSLIAQETFFSYGVGYEYLRLSGDPDPFIVSNYPTHHNLGDISYGKMDDRKLLYGVNTQFGYRHGWGDNDTSIYSSALFTWQMMFFVRKYYQIHPKYLFGVQAELIGGGGNGSTWLSSHNRRGGFRFNEYKYFFGFRPSLAYAPKPDKWIMDFNIGNYGFGSLAYETPANNTTTKEHYDGSFWDFGYLQVQYIRYFKSK